MSLRKQILFPGVISEVGEGRAKKAYEVDSSAYAVLFPGSTAWTFGLSEKNRGGISLEYTFGKCCVVYIFLGDF